MVGPSIIGSEKGIPTSMASAPGAGQRLEGEQPLVVDATGDVGHEQLVPGVAPQAAAGPTRGGRVTARRTAVTTVGAQDVADLGDVLVPATGEIDQDGRPGRQLAASRPRRSPRRARGPTRARG